MSRTASPETAARLRALRRLQREVVACERCPRLRRWCRAAPQRAPRAWRGERYWAKPVPSFGDPRARIVLVGLAPGAHGANRTGRPFTGDGSGDFLFSALNRAGLASAARSLAAEDGLELRDVLISNAVRCAPPHNRPSPREFERCEPFLARELELCADARVVLCLGADAWRAVARVLRSAGSSVPRPLPRFAHGASYRAGPLLVLASFHPSRLNTQTGRLTAREFDALVERAVAASRA